MQRSRTFVFVAAFLGLATVGGAAANAATYTTAILHPAGFDYSFAEGVSAGSQVGYGGMPIGGGLSVNRALLWQGSAASYVDLTPAGFTTSFAYDVLDGKQVGEADGHAILWSGTAASYVDLNPANAADSIANAMFSTYQVGSAAPNFAPGTRRATRWEGTAASAIDLHPVAFTNSNARAMGAGGIVGEGRGLETSDFDHALFWPNGAPVVNLNPAGYRTSYATGISGANQVGFGSPGDSLFGRALLWSGSAASAVELHPTGFDSTVATDILGGTQIGSGVGTATGGFNHALLWNGTAASVEDLHPFLAGHPINFTSSETRAIGSDGTIVGVASDGLTSYAVMWTPVVPEPATGLALWSGLVMLSGMCRGGRR